MVKLKVTWTKSSIGQKRDQGATLRALGLKRLGQTVIHNNTPDIIGMTNKIKHLVTVEEVQ